MLTSSPSSPLEFIPGQRVARIVVPVLLVEQYDRGVAAAAKLAERFDLPLRLVSVEIGDAPPVVPDRGLAMTAAVAALEAAHPSVSVTHQLLSAESHPATAFSGGVRDSDLVVIATKAMAGPVGSFAQETVSMCQTPVLMLGPEASLARDDAGVVFVGVDGSVLAERIVPAARGLAAALGAQVKLIHVVPASVSAHVEKLRQRGQKVSESAYVQDLCERIGDPSVTWEVVHHDDAGVALVALAARAHPAALAMATHGREGFVAQVFGSITQAVVHNVVCPVLVQHPVGVGSPTEIV